MSNEREWNELIDRHLHGELTDPEKERLAQWLDSDPDRRRDFVDHVAWNTRIAEVLRENREETVEQVLESNRGGSSAFTKVLLAMAAVALIAFTINILKRTPVVAPQLASVPIAKINSVNGTLLWTFDGGKVVRDLDVGTELIGGTVEGVTPDSLVELEFNDGSTVTISGVSTLTFSDGEQKELHLKEGDFSASVNPQPAGKPMLVHTRTATLEVLGTQFNVDAGSFATTLDVSEGKVRVKRLSDGDTMVVPAKHRLTAAADREMSLTPMPESVGSWSSQLRRGPRGMQGKWLPAAEDGRAQLQAVPFTTKQGKTIYTVSLPVSSGDNPPVVLSPGSSIRVRGRVESECNVYVGMTVRHANGDFAGRFQVVRPKEAFEPGKEFEWVIPLRDYRLDPSLNHVKHSLPGDPVGLVVGYVWCHSLYDQAGLAISQVELIASDEG